MRIQQIRNATLKIIYGGVTFLLDPWLQDKGTGFSARAVSPEMQGVKNPMNELPIPPDEIIKGVDYCLVTHVHPDHFTQDYLPSDMNIIAQNDDDIRKIREQGFENVSAIEETSVKIGNVTIAKTPAVHGENEQVLAKMGKSCGYVLSGEEKTLYIVGDTVFYEGVERTLNKYAPDVIIVNCCEATIPLGRLIMNLNDMQSVCELRPNAAVIATHLDSVNHALVSSDDVRQFAIKNNLSQIIVPKNGEWIER